MKPVLLYLFALIPLFAVQAEETPYQKSRQELWDRFAKLDTERADYRKREPKLTPAQEQEWLRLKGQILRDDPITTLLDQMQADLDALNALPSPTDSDKALIEDFKELLAFVSSYGDNATSSLAEATAYATTMRQFVARRDVKGAARWLKSKYPE